MNILSTTRQQTYSVDKLLKNTTSQDFGKLLRLLFIL